MSNKILTLKKLIEKYKKEKDKTQTKRLLFQKEEENDKMFFFKLDLLAQKEFVLIDIIKILENVKKDDDLNKALSKLKEYKERYTTAFNFYKNKIEETKDTTHLKYFKNKSILLKVEEERLKKAMINIDKIIMQ